MLFPLFSEADLQISLIRLNLGNHLGKVYTLTYVFFMGWQGTPLCMLQGCAAKKDETLKDFCPKTATELNHHDLKLGLVRKLRERMNTFPFNSK